MKALPASTRGVIAVLAAMAMVVLDAGIANVALPTIAASLETTPERSVLVVTAYQAALVMGILPAAHLAGRLGMRRLFVSGIATFSLASLLCGLAPSLPLLVGARFVQGLGGAAIIALGIALLRAALGDLRLGAAIGWNALNVALCSAVAPTIGALILTLAGWPWLFPANLPLGLAAAAAARALPEDPPPTASVDLPGVALWATGTGLLVVATELASQWRLWPLLAIASFACIGVLVRREMPKAAPLVPFDLLRRRPFRLSVMASVCCFVGQSAGILALPFYLQLVCGRSPLVTGLVITCWPAAVALTSTAANALSRRFSPALVCLTGGLTLGLGLLGSVLAPGVESVAPLAACVAICGIGFGLFQVTNNRTMFLAAPPDRSAAAGGVQGTARLAGQTAGALTITILFSHFGISAPAIALALGAGCAFAAAAVSALQSGARARQPARSPYSRPSIPNRPAHRPAGPLLNFSRFLHGEGP
jgi:DHA2 family multidrug resistance protein-like MFS transporter